MTNTLDARAVAWRRAGGCGLARRLVFFGRALGISAVGLRARGVQRQRLQRLGVAALELQPKGVVKGEAVVRLAEAVVDVVEDEQTLDRVDGGVEGEVGPQVDAVEVGARLVGAVVAAGDAVRIEQRHQLEHKVLAQELGARVVLAQDELEEAVENECYYLFEIIWKKLKLFGII